ncbi:hypothetical protein F5Y01DRAFT_272578 [Xylaria sp. FL0043]|nr:hypothetical protein F5Y01DRAFT_272578 [Xylaria sp. FL0043]
MSCSRLLVTILTIRILSSNHSLTHSRPILYLMDRIDERWDILSKYIPRHSALINYMRQCSDPGPPPDHHHYHTTPYHTMRRRRWSPMTVNPDVSARRAMAG